VGTNGTYLDGKRVTHETLVDGSIIRLARSGPNIQVRMGEVALAERSPHAIPVHLPDHADDVPLTSSETLD
jgi:pSer/pThr/pTyr-binding forkhead associated (FHA) protein